MEDHLVCSYSLESKFGLHIDGIFPPFIHMDFVQPEGLQIVGQLASYLASLPAAGVTVFSILVAVYRTKINWSLTNLLFFIGVAGWVIGGLGAVIDATISNNFVLHNTLCGFQRIFIPTMRWAMCYLVLASSIGLLINLMWASIRNKNAMLKLTLILFGGIGFLLAFYIGGADSIPRRYSNYPPEFTMAAPLATVAAVLLPSIC